MAFKERNKTLFHSATKFWLRLAKISRTNEITSHVTSEKWVYELYFRLYKKAVNTV